MSADLEHFSGETYPETLEEQVAALKRDDTLRRFRESRESLASDPYRPLYHFSPPENSMNDPNGLCQWQGRYHLFYQFKPVGIDRVHWGHAVSDDLVAWRDLPPALYPDREHHCFSGQALVEPERVVAIYHGTESGNSIATASDPLLLNWQKHPNNPVIPIVPIDENGRPYRVFDPCIWKQDDGYYYSLAGTYRDGEIGHDCRAVDYVFRSKDLSTWDRLGPLIDGTPNTEPGEDGAVPNFLPIGPDKHMLLFFSHKRAGQYYIGDYDPDSHRLKPERHGRMNYGPFTVGSLHAPSATIDEQGRFIALFNVKEGIEPRGIRVPDAQPEPLRPRFRVDAHPQRAESEPDRPITPVVGQRHRFRDGLADRPGLPVPQTQAALGFRDETNRPALEVEGSGQGRRVFFGEDDGQRRVGAEGVGSIRQLEEPVPADDARIGAREAGPS